jgi:hypothetical protein
MCCSDVCSILEIAVLHDFCIRETVSYMISA